MIVNPPQYENTKVIISSNWIDRAEVSNLLVLIEMQYVIDLPVLMYHRS